MFQLQLFFLLFCDEWDLVVALPKHKFVTGATLLQLDWKVRASFKNGQSKKSHYVLISKHTLIPLFTEHFLFQ